MANSCKIGTLPSALVQELQPVCQEQDVELSSIVLEISSHDVWNPCPQKTVFLFLLDHCCYGPMFRCENHAFWHPVHQ